MAVSHRNRAAGLAKRALSAAAAAAGLYRLAGTVWGGLGVILMLHRVVEAGRPILEPGYEIGADALDAVLASTRRMGWQAVTLDEVHRRLTGERAGGRFVCFTLDDGYRDNLEVALPVFRRHRIPFCTYVCTGLVERSVFYWWGALAALVTRESRIEWPGPGPGAARVLEAGTWAQKRLAHAALSDLCYAEEPARVRDWLRAQRIDVRAVMDRDVLSEAQVRELASDPLVTVGAHAMTHGRLSEMDDAAAAREIEGSRRLLERWIGREVRHLAYPFGGPTACGPREFELARRAGYATATTTRRGNLFPGHRDHLTALPRRTGPSDAVGLRNALSGVESLLRRWPRFRAA